MIHNAVKLVLVAFAIFNITSAGSILKKSKRDFTYLGSYAKPKTGVKAGDYENYYYYVSVNPTIHEVSGEDCLKVFGKGATLLSLETKEEQDFITEMLSDTGTSASKFWTSGVYDTESKIWRWDDGTPIPSPAPWGQGFPTNPNGASRIALHYGNKFSTWWETYYNTVMARYICEFPRSTIAMPCSEDNDLEIVIDSSGSVGPDYFALALNFTAKLATAWKENSGNRVGVITFSNKESTIVELTSPLDTQALVNKILSTPFVGGGTATHLGLNAAIEQEVASDRGVKRNIVVLTDGASQSPTETAAKARHAKEIGIRTFAVGITASVIEGELLEIAGLDKDHVFYAETFDQLIQLMTPLSSIICYD